MPDLPRHLTITRELGERASPQLKALFTKIDILDHAKHQHRPRFESAMLADLDQAIFVDGDTLFLAPVYELFDVLDHFEIGLATAPQYFSPLASKMGIPTLLPKTSTAIPEWNSGVIVARIGERFRSFVAEWSRLFEECIKAGFTMDQAALRVALVHSDLRIATIANNYNFRALIPQHVTGQVKILHAHGELQRIARKVNMSVGMRVFVPDTSDIHGYHPK